MTVRSVDALSTDQVRQALSLLGWSDPPTQRGAGLRALRDTLSSYGTVRAVLASAPAGARQAFVSLVQHGPTSVEQLLGRGWWGRGRLPPPLDWLQVRALVLVDDDGRLLAPSEAVSGFAELTLDLDDHPQSSAAEKTLRVEAAGCVVVASSPAGLQGALQVPAAELKLVAPTVAVSPRSDAAVSGALRAAGHRLADDMAVVAAAGALALPGMGDDAVGPRSVRSLLARAVDERRQLHLTYYASSRGGAATDRTVDPWAFADDLLRGYCHLRQGERTFAVDRIGRARLLQTSLVHEPWPGSN